MAADRPHLLSALDLPFYSPGLFSPYAVEIDPLSSVSTIPFFLGSVQWLQIEIFTYLTEKNNQGEDYE